MYQNIIFFYSKYSNKCKKFLEISSNIISYTLICVDNKDVRQQILDSDNVQIKSVPCLLILTNNSNNIEKYEGNDCFLWIQNIISQNESKNQKIKKSSTPSQQSQSSSSVTSINNIDENFIEDHEENILLNQDENLNVIENETKQEIIIDDEMQKKMEYEEMIENGNIHGVKKKETGKKTNLITLAQEMQKVREIEETHNNNAKKGSIPVNTYPMK
jgi:hypothetical protein